MNRSGTRSILALGLGLAVIAALAACSGSPAPPATQGGAASSTATAPSTPATFQTGAPVGHAIVTIKDFSFDPADLTVKVGTVVTWKNGGGTDHTVDFDDGSISSGKIAPGISATHIFKSAGTFSYHCSIHPRMKGRVVVK